MAKTLLFFSVLLIQPLIANPVYAKNAAPLTVNRYAGTLEIGEKHLLEMIGEMTMGMKSVVTIASTEDGADTDSGAETSPGEDDTDADTDSDSDDDADSGNSALTPAEQ